MLENPGKFYSVSEIFKKYSTKILNLELLVEILINFDKNYEASWAMEKIFKNLCDLLFQNSRMAQWVGYTQNILRCLQY